MTAFLSTPSARRATRSFSSLRSAQRDFYPRPPRGGRRSCCARSSRGGRFLSTPSARRATSASPAPSTHPSDFYPRPPRGGRPLSRLPCRTLHVISIHALREEGDQCHPYRRHSTSISIHALREEGDLQNAGHGILLAEDFYPRPPRGGRQQKQRQNLYFQTNYTTFCTNLEEP